MDGKDTDPRHASSPQSRGAALNQLAVDRIHRQRANQALETAEGQDTINNDMTSNRGSVARAGTAISETLSEIMGDVTSYVVVIKGKRIPVYIAAGVIIILIAVLITINILMYVGVAFALYTGLVSTFD